MRSNISVCMAAYNGSKYIKQQIDSILCQLQSGDELIIVDDCSTDNTFEIIKNIEWSGLRVYQNEKNLRHVKTFARAIDLAINPIIFLSDQDDIWLENRVNLMVAELERHESVLLLSRHANFHGTPDRMTIDKQEFAQKSTMLLPFVALIKLLIGESQLPYFGCSMAFRRELKKLLLPFPEKVEAHDHWIAFCAVAYGSFLFVDYPTVQRRVHDKNLSPTTRRSIELVIKTRIRLIKHYLCALQRKSAVLASS